MPAFLTNTCFRGAIVRAPFLGPSTDCRPPADLAVAVDSFFDFSVPCAILNPCSEGCKLRRGVFLVAKKVDFICGRWAALR